MKGELKVKFRWGAQKLVVEENLMKGELKDVPYVLIKSLTLSESHEGRIESVPHFPKRSFQILRIS